MKTKLTLLLALCSLFFYAQNSSFENFGKITRLDAETTHFENDSTANALVMHENAETQFLIKNNRVVISTAYYYKIKIFNQEGFKHATFSIPLQNNDNRGESVDDLEAITHNGFEKTYLAKNNVFTKRINERWKETTFTLPKLKEGSIIEVKYVVNSPFMFNLTGWEFQSEIPKLYSEYKATIPGNYVYSRKLIGFLHLTKNQSDIKKKCFKVPGYAEAADCEVITYAMSNVPAFIEEAFTTDIDNYLSRIKFELSEWHWFDGQRQLFSKTWENVDKEYRTDNNIGRQLKKYDFFEDKLPAEVATAANDLEKAKIIHGFIRDHFTYNGQSGLGSDVNVKKAYEEIATNSPTINIALINALKAAGLNVNMMLISTRGNGFPTREYPVIGDFNYLVAKLDIGEKSYLLDATEKNAPFNLLPYRCLNSYGRVMDFENGSYWYDIVPNQNSKQQTYVSLELQEDGSYIGKIRNVNYNYDAFDRREEIKNATEESIIASFESSFPNLYVENYEVSNLDNLEKPVTETYDVLIEGNEGTTMKLINPFLAGTKLGNPFKQENRMYPVDFGYPRKYYLNFSMELADGYIIKSIPKSQKMVLEEDGGSYSLITRKKENWNIQLRSALTLKKSKYYNFEYGALKMLFENIAALQNSDIVIENGISK